jgi:probable rRNA maturation factor
MTVALDVQFAVNIPGLPDEADLRHWAGAALAGQVKDTELVIRIVGEAESAALNQTYRHKHGPTNVLSFPFEAPVGVDLNLLGDVVICAPVVLREAVVQSKAPAAHWAHMVVHGVLHLLGYDHGDDAHAAEMETLEARILHSLGYPDPYTEAENQA